MKNLNDTLFWKKKYGVLPLHLNDINQDRYLMLNGGNGDFCLQTFDEGDEQLFKEYAWSANTKNYLIIEENSVRVINWLDDKTDTLKKETILSNIDKFHDYLLYKSYKTQNDVIPFVLHVFRKLRNTTDEKHSPLEALNLLFQLLMNLNEETASNVFSDFEKVELPNSFEQHLNILKEGVKSIKPNLDIILRHVSGALFEEAHKEVIYFDHQLDLFGGRSSKQKIMLNRYSSVHYTPAYIARSIVENSLKEIDLTNKPSLKILDPSCGSSEFIIEALKQLKNIAYKGDITIEAYDISETAIQTSKFLLHYENITQWGGNLKLNIRKVNNSLEEDWGNGIDLLLMNPPFISWELLKDKKARNVLIEVLDAKSNRGKPNLASGFLYKAIQSLGEKGVIGCIMPTSIFTFESYNKLRDEIKERIDLKLLAKLGNYAFENALTDVSVFIGKRPQSTSIPQIIWTNNQKDVVTEVLRELRKMQTNNEIASIDKKYNIYTPKRFPIMAENWKIVTQKEEKFIDELEVYVANKRLVRLIDVFTVRQGIRSGARNIFKIPKYELENDRHSDLFRPVIDNSSIKKGVLIDDTYIWYPYDKEGMKFESEDDIAEKDIPFFNNILHPNKDILSKRSGISVWWGLTRPRNWQFEKKPKLISTEFGRSDSFAFDAKGEYVVERGNAWIPKSMFEDEDYYFYLALFSSSMFDKLLNIFSKQLAGGKWYDLGAKYTKNIPIPDLKIAKENISSYQRLSELGRKLSLGSTDALYSINDEVKYYYP